MLYTFYSYRGGAGRSMAVSNVAVLLHRRGLNVIAVDCDLERPALETYLLAGRDDTGGGSRPGFVDLVRDFKDAMSSPPSGVGDNARVNLPDLKSYLQLVDWDGEKFIKLLSAGRRLGDDADAYEEAVRRFDWDDFYSNWEGRIFFEWLRRGLNGAADVVLVNSSAGITEIGRVCTDQLADAVIMLCPSDPQSCAGTLKLALSLSGAKSEPRAAVAAAAAAGVAGVSTTVGTTAARGKRVEPPDMAERRRLLIVPSRVEGQKKVRPLRESFRKQFIRDFKSFLPEEKRLEPDYFWKLRLPYVPTFSFSEQLAARAEGVPAARRMVKAYEGLVEAMVRLAPPDYRGSESGEEKAPARKEAAAEIYGLEPYRSLLPFYEQHARLFFGRDGCIRELVERVNAGGMIAVVGQSGSGKSSLVHAGLLPRVREGELRGGKDWRIVIVTPDIHPLDRLADELCRQSLMPGVALLGDPEALAKRLEEEPGSLAPVVSHVMQGRAEDARLLLVVDQFEELVTLSDWSESLGFIREMVGAVGAGRLVVVFTMRQDFYDDIMERNADLREAVGTNMLRLGRMEEPGLLDAVTKPAELMGLVFEPGLVDRILVDVGKEPGNLPLLQFALTKLWDGRDGARLTHHVYTKIGGVKGAIADEAERVYGSLSGEEQEIARKVFTHLVQLNENVDGPNTRRRTTYAELGEQARPVVKKLADKRLLVAGSDDSGAGAENSRFDQIEIAHEALIQNWPRLREWLKDDRDFLLWRQKLWRDMVVWKDENEDEDALLRGPVLRRAQEQLSERAGELSQAVKDFIDRSEESRKGRHAAERRKRRRRTLTASAALLVVVLSSVYALWARRQKQNVVNASSYFIQGSEAEMAGAYPDALDKYSAAIAVSPELADPYFARAYVYARMGGDENYQRALQDLNKYLSLKPASAEAYNSRGEIYLKIGFNDEQLINNALSDFDNATRLDEGFTPAWYNRGMALVALGKFEDAIRAFDKAAETQPAFRKPAAGAHAAYVELSHILNDRGKAYFQLWKTGDDPPDSLRQHALADFDAAIKQDSGFAEPYYNTGVALAANNEQTKAVQYFTEAIDHDSKYGEAYNARGEAREKLSQYKHADPKLSEDAFEDFSAAVKFGYRPALLNLARAYLRRADADKAAENFNQALAYDDKSALAYWGRGQALALKGDHAAAVEDFNRALSLDGDLLGAYFSRGVSYDELNKAEAARADLLTFVRGMEHADDPEEYGKPEYMKGLPLAYARLTKLGYKAQPEDASVSVHYSDSDGQALANQIEAALKHAGFHKITLSESVSRDNEPLVKFFNGTDKGNAVRALAAVNSVSDPNKGQRKFGLMPIPSSVGKHYRFGLIEVWIPPSARETATPTPEVSPTPDN